MSERRQCSRCGAELAADTPGGHCLPCLLLLGLAPEKPTAEQQPEAGNKLEAGTGRSTESRERPLAEKPGDRIGPYKLLQQIGEGGCGIVYMAEQEQPIRRRVALKLIKLGMDTRSVIARFEAEWQALAMMDHPNIAKIYDAGATDTPFGRSAGFQRAVSPISNRQMLENPHVPESVDGPQVGSAALSRQAGKSLRYELSPGRPYFVMELVRGVKITTYCDQQRLSTQQRLDLFIQVCQAVQHAH